MQNFYGGQSGQSFEIKWIFNTRYGDGNSLANDIKMGWSSPIAVGEFVIISYGMANNDTYDTFLKQDGENFNSTLWQKVYQQGGDSVNGITYRFISQMTGNTPNITVGDVSGVIIPPGNVAKVLDADKSPAVWIEKDNKDNPIIYFALPKSQVMRIGPVEELAADGKPQVEYNEDNINEPLITFKLPVAQVIKQATIKQYLDVDKMPEVKLNTNQDDATITNPILEFKLPQSQVLQMGSVTSTGPSEAPAVELDSKININKPQLNFTLPRAVKFYYGDRLGTQEDLTDDDASLEGLLPGDYYINETTGFVYEVTAVSEGEWSFHYVACLQAPKPLIKSEEVDPYQEDGSLTEPTVEDDHDEDGNWRLNFKLPKPAAAGYTFSFIPSIDAGTVKIAPKGTDTLFFDFKIPAGTKMLAGNDVTGTTSDVVVDGAVAGDLYLNTVTGRVYVLQKDNTWITKQGNLKGPTGDALYTEASYEITETEEIKNSLEAGVAYIEDNYVGEITPDKIFPVNWNIIDEEGTIIQQISYWYFKTNSGDWSRALLTGGIGDLIETEYNDENSGAVDTKAYSVHYTNSLIGGERDPERIERTTYSMKQIEEMLSWGTWDDATEGE